MSKSSNLVVIIVMCLFAGCGKNTMTSSKTSSANVQPESANVNSNAQSANDCEIKLKLLKDGKPVDEVFVWLAGVDGNESKLLDAEANKFSENRLPAIDVQANRFSPRCVIVTGDNVVFRAKDAEANVGFTDQTWSMNIPAGEEWIQRVDCNGFPGRLSNDLARGDSKYGYLLVLGHVFGAVSNQDGIATLTNVPNGEFLIRVWHPDLRSPDVFVINSKEENFTHGRCEITLNQDVVEGQVIWREQP